MSRLLRAELFRQRWTPIGAILIVLAMALRAGAAISEGPKTTNAAAAEERRRLQFHDADVSLQDKVRVGRERYEQKQMERAKVIQAMSAQLEARQQTVVIQPAVVPDAKPDYKFSLPVPWPEAAMVAACFIGMGYYGVRLKWTSGSESSQDGKSAPWRARPARARYRITALKPVTICANVEVAKTERHLAGGRRSNTKERPAWIKLKAGEIRDKVGVVFGIHPECAPHGRRVYLSDANSDIVPLGTWNDGDLPKKFFEYFVLEISD
jgi:hypothetical protein